MLIRSNLISPRMATALFAVLVKKLGGEVEVKRADLEDISPDSLEEEDLDDGSIRFRLKTRKME